MKSILACINAEENPAESSETVLPEEKEVIELNKQAARKFKSFEKHLQKVDLNSMSELDRQNLNEVIRDVQDTLAQLIYVHKKYET